ncbi:ComF family protein [Paenibacillus prosopidis]|uniref:ComF family protein n=1 Tax=Paenibacillus prosopidis TaxID=630520 RepID=A0A368VXA6_9BACL|nr:ComF family protein [Paenibacillus prosopidis]RCW44822.1 ComF family protein [Paenibacillus prosopidis]
MSSSLSSLLQRFRSAFSASAQLLAPYSAACCMCGKSRNDTRNANSPHPPKLTAQLRQSLCEQCLSAIPWLTRIMCPTCGRGIHCDDCVRSPHRSFVCNRSAVQYSQSMKTLLAQYKYRGDEQLAPLLAHMLLPAFETMTAELAKRQSATASRGSHKKIQYADYWDVITYVPISSERAMDRGFNQAEQLASYLAQRYRLPLMHLLVRERHTEKQSFKTRSERMRDTRSLFNVNDIELSKLQTDAVHPVRNAHLTHTAIRVLLIDDIYTTGSTSEACSQTLHQYAAKPLEIYVLTWARS